ncbi:MAG: hypothetical protein IKO84_10290 [Butyrivibrio sp.]|nr:hypothetical protein [Butyrivibrio sp.]
MSLIYDQTANNKPANGAMLHLNNEGFKQEQNNINNNESTLKLDISALSSQEEINGTECVGLLLEQWRTVASICDIFRNFGTGVLDPTLGKMAMSINTIDHDAASSVELENVLDLKKSGNNAKASWFSDLLELPLIPGRVVNNLVSGMTQSAGMSFESISNRLFGIEIEDLMRISIAPWSLFVKPKGADATDPFDDFGLYGGNQVHVDASISNILPWMGLIPRTGDEIYDFVRSHEGYENYSDEQIRTLLGTITNTGCTYTAAANAIFWHYRNHADLFEKKFGFPIKGKNGDLNYRKLIIDFYLNTNKKIYLDEESGLDLFTNYYLERPDEFKETYKQYYWVNENGNYVSNNVELSYEDIVLNTYLQSVKKGETVITTKDDYTFAVGNRLAHYSREKDLGLMVEFGGYTLDSKKIEEALNNGDIVEMSAKARYQFEDGSYYGFGIKVPIHSMIITGIMPDGRYKVSTWGTKLYVDPKELEDVHLNIIKLDPKVLG